MTSILLLMVSIVCDLSSIAVLSLHCHSKTNNINSSGPIDHSWNSYLSEVYNTNTADSHGSYLVNKTDIQFLYKNTQVKLRPLDWPPQDVPNSGLKGVYHSIVERYWTGYSSDRFIAADHSWVEVQRFKVG